jgi:hypothetical protein
LQGFTYVIDVTDYKAQLCYYIVNLKAHIAQALSNLILLSITSDLPQQIYLQAGRMEIKG